MRRGGNGRDRPRILMEGRACGGKRERNGLGERGLMMGERERGG